MSVKKYILWSLLSTIIHSNINALNVNVALDVEIKTEYLNCQPIAEKIRQLVEAYVAASEQDRKISIAQKIKRNKRKLKKCEKENSNWFNKTIASINGGQAGLTYKF